MDNWRNNTERNEIKREDTFIINFNNTKMNRGSLLDAITELLCNVNSCIIEKQKIGIKINKFIIMVPMNLALNKGMEDFFMREIERLTRILKCDIQYIRSISVYSSHQRPAVQEGVVQVYSGDY